MLPNVPEEVLTMIRGVDEPGWLADLIAFSPEFSSEQRQELLEVLEPVERLRRLSVMVQKRIDVLNLRQQIQTEAQAGMDKQQREYYLREQLRGDPEGARRGRTEAAVATEPADQVRGPPGCPGGGPGQSHGPTRAARAAAPLLARDRRHPRLPGVAGSSCPWATETEDRLDLKPRPPRPDEAIHYGLDKVKERIVEFIAVRKLAGDKLRRRSSASSAPGVGKTSLGRSIARAIGRTTSGCRSAASATRPRSAATGGPTSAPCRAA
jgi:ATP-dependent Lon protease